MERFKRVLSLVESTRDDLGDEFLFSLDLKLLLSSKGACIAVTCVSVTFRLLALES